MRTSRLALLALLAACGGSSGPPALLARQELVEACVRLNACRPTTTAVLTATACARFTEAERAALPVSQRDAARCAAEKLGDCAAVLSCWAGGEGGGGCSQTAQPFCVSEHEHWQCLAGATMVTDCALDDLTCVPATAMGMVAACGEGPCDMATFAAHCRGAELVTCEAGVAVARACAEGASCQGDAAGAACTGTGPPCPPETPDRCDGTGLVRCVGGAEARKDCAAGGYAGTCEVPQGGGAPACVGTFKECDPATFVDRCNGPRLEYCQDGRVRGVDCTALGFLGCRIGDPAMGVASRCRAAAPIDPDAGVPDAGPPDAMPSDGGP